MNSKQPQLDTHTFDTAYVSGYRIQYADTKQLTRRSPWCTDLDTEFDDTISAMLDDYANYQIVRHSLFSASVDELWQPSVCQSYKQRLFSLYTLLTGESFMLSDHLSEEQALTLCLAVTDRYFQRVGIINKHDVELIDELRYFLEPYFVHGMEVDVRQFRLTEYAMFRVGCKLAEWLKRDTKPIHNVFGF